MPATLLIQPMLVPKKQDALLPQRRIRSTLPVGKSVCACVALFCALAHISADKVKVYPEATDLFYIFDYNNGFCGHAARHCFTVGICIRFKLNFRFAKCVGRGLAD